LLQQNLRRNGSREPYALRQKVYNNSTHLANNSLPSQKANKLLFVCCPTEKPYFSQEPEDVTVLVGDTATLQCHVRGMPPPEVKWYRQDSNMPAGRTELIDGVLRIKDSQPEDEGLYFCEASNDLGSVRAAARLTLHCKQTKKATFSFFSSLKLLGTLRIRKKRESHPPLSLFFSLLKIMRS
jgi:hypothetical protein